MAMRVLLLAGEESGLIYADGLAERLRAKFPGVEIRGYGDYGFKVADLAVMGFWPVIKKLGYFLAVKRMMIRALDEWRPQVVLTVDYPGLNLRLAAAAKRRGIRAVHVVCPQVWAWKRGRIPKIEAALDRLCCFFPFEPQLFRPGFATFVGHPLAKEEFAAARREERLVALLPGSREGEIGRILPTLLKVAAEMPAVRFAIPAANDRAYARIEAELRKREELRSRVEVLSGGARELLGRAQCAVVASGTATLEAALARCPTVLVYRLSPPLWWFARHFVRGTRFAGLANIIWERSRPGFDEHALRPVALENIVDETAPMPELLQERMTSAAIREYLGKWLTDDACRAEAVRRLEAVTGLLATGDDPLAAVVWLL